MRNVIIRARGAMRLADRCPRPQFDLTIACVLPDMWTRTAREYLSAKGWFAGDIEIEPNYLEPLITKGKPNVTTVQ